MVPSRKTGSMKVQKFDEAATSKHDDVSVGVNDLLR
jgi:hypothetical protein